MHTQAHLAMMMKYISNHTKSFLTVTISISLLRERESLFLSCSGSSEGRVGWRVWIGLPSCGGEGRGSLLLQGL